MAMNDQSIIFDAPGVEETTVLAVLSSWASAVGEADLPNALVLSVDFEGAGNGQQGSENN